jgi:hypothetical protein
MEEAATKKVLVYPFATKYCIAVNNYKALELVLHMTNSSSSVAALLPIFSKVFFHLTTPLFKLVLLLFKR